MSLWRQLRYGWRGLRDRAGREQDVADEVAQYFDEAEAEWRERGLSEEEARRAARREAGSMVTARERASEYGWENGVTVFLDDLRFAARQLWKHPAFTVTAVLTLALGIGANTAIFTVVERVLLAPLAYNNVDRLALLKTYRGQLGRAIPRVTGPDAADVRDQSQSLEAVSLYGGGNLGVQLKDHATFTVVTMADANFAKVFALQPMAGRLYTDADAKHAVLVSERFARDNFGGAQEAVGQVLGVEGEPQEIVGVVGHGFDYPNGTQVWKASPIVPESRSRTAFNYRAVALLGRDAGFVGAQTELKTISQRLQAAYAKDNQGKEMVLQPLKDALTGDSGLFIEADDVMGHLDGGFGVVGEAGVNFGRDAAGNDGENFLSEFDGEVFEGEVGYVFVGGAVAELLVRVEQRLIHNGLILRHLRGRGDKRRVRGRILWLGFFNGFNVTGVGDDDRYFAELLEQSLRHVIPPDLRPVYVGYIA